MDRCWSRHNGFIDDCLWSSVARSRPSGRRIGESGTQLACSAILQSSQVDEERPEHGKQEAEKSKGQKTLIEICKPGYSGAA